MAARQAALNSRALATLLDKNNRVSRMSDSFGDFCFFHRFPKCVECVDTGIPTNISISNTSTRPQPGFPDLPKEVRDRIYDLLVENVRAEIGSALWKKDIRVDADHWEYLLIDFLEDRPAIHEGIKELRMEWACEGSPGAVDSEIIDLGTGVPEIKILDESEGHDEDEIHDLAEELKPLLELALHPHPVDTTSDISDE
ncbi:uncharacterized protein PAC_09705 [Phialocephala subalpina]|uniref:Uncharacterized protein n=1 Tax=Phialocephala subalpina TaxID=576137 RepID=A0A1L7X474_9HELO|nr:uncharacterized protein PAC_09705 [Phialocephala subalpina]